MWFSPCRLNLLFLGTCEFLLQYEIFCFWERNQLSGFKFLLIYTQLNICINSVFYCWFFFRWLKYLSSFPFRNRYWRNFHHNSLSLSLPLYDINEKWMRYWWMTCYELGRVSSATCHLLSCHLVSFLVHSFHCFLHLFPSSIDSLFGDVILTLVCHSNLRRNN